MTVRGMPADFSLKSNTITAFTTPILHYVWPDSEGLNAGLRRTILGKETNNPGVSASNVGGWHSESDLLSWPQTEIKILADRFQAFTSCMMRTAIAKPGALGRITVTAEAWANVVRSGHYNLIHAHPNFMWSGVYYVATGKPDPDTPSHGAVEFIDPRDAVNHVSLGNLKFAMPLRLNPEPGLMLMFPSWLKHTVHPYFGEGERVSIAFNAIARTFDS